MHSFIIYVFFYLFINLFVHFFGRSFIYVVTCLFIYRCIRSFLRPFVYLRIHMFFYLSINLFVHFFVCSFIYVFTRSFIYLSIYSPSFTQPVFHSFIFSLVHIFHTVAFKLMVPTLHQYPPRTTQSCFDTFFPDHITSTTAQGYSFNVH